MAPDPAAGGDGAACTIDPLVLCRRDERMTIHGGQVDDLDAGVVLFYVPDTVKGWGEGRSLGVTPP
jgi:hypothetical protein